MSLSSPYSEIYHVADGVTTRFSFGQSFQALNAIDIKCVIYFQDGTNCVPTFNVNTTEGYIDIVTLTKPDGTVLTVPPADSTVRIFRETPEAQNITASQLQNYTAKQLEKIFDSIVAMIQENAYTAEHKTVRLTETQRDVFLQVLTELVDGSLLYWDNDSRTIKATDFPHTEIVRCPGGLFFRVSTRDLKNYLEWSINGTEWHSLDFAQLSDIINTLGIELNNLKEKVATNTQNINAEIIVRRNEDQDLQSQINQINEDITDYDARITQNATNIQALDDKLDSTVTSSDPAMPKSYIDGLVTGIYHIKGVVDTVADLPATGNVVGDCWNVLEDGNTYIWTEDEEWINGGSAMDFSPYRTAADQDIIDAGKQDKLTAGTDIEITAGNVINMTGKFGKSISLAGKKLSLKDQDNTTLSETMLALGVDAEYDSEEEDIEFQEGEEGDVSFLQEQIDTINSKIPDSASVANKLVPTSDLGDGVLTIQKNHVTVGTFSANQSTNKTINIDADSQVQADWEQTDSTQPDYILHKPTNVSDFTNDANYQNASQVGTSITTAIGEHNTASDAHSNIITPIKASITDIQALIPSAATTSNQLADKDFVNSSIATSTATFRGTYNTLAELEAQTADKEDYGFVITTDAAGNTLYNRYKYNGTSWLYEYTLNNSSFTAAQWAAINSGVTPAMVEDYLDPNSTSSTAYNTRISTLMLNKLSKTSTPSCIYGTNSAGAQTLYLAGDNIELGTDGKINVVGVQQQMFEMPEATADLLGSIVQYLGDDDGRYTHGVMYQCVPVYGSFTVTSVGINNVTLDEEVFKESFLYDASIPSYTFECTRGGLRQTWRLPNGQSWMGALMDFGIGFMGRPSVGATITLTRSVVGYAWEAYAGVSAGNDKIKIVGEKISGINVVGQYNQTTMPAARAELAGKIIQFNGESDLLSMYRDGHFYRCEENRNMRNYTLEADPMKYSTLVVDNWLALEDFMFNYDNPVTFMWQGVGRGWVEEESMSMLGTEDLTQYGITYTLESGQTLEVGDKIIINFTSSYFWHHIPVQDGVGVSNYLPEASSEYVDRVLLLNNVLDGSLPEPESLGVAGKLYTCIEKYNEMTGDLEYEWQPLPYQFNLLQYTELPSDPTKVYTDQCVQYVGASQIWEKYAEDVYLENGHIYRATIVDEDDPDFAAVRYVDAYPYQMLYMPDPIAAYEGVVTQYVGTDGTFTNGHFYKCVPTGQMTGPSDKYKKPEDAEWSVSINPNVLGTHTTDPDQAQVFEFRSQAEGADWVLKVSDTTWQTVSLADYGITVTGTVPYGSELKVKYIEPQPEYEWQEITVQQGGGGGVVITYDATTKTITFA